MTLTDFLLARVAEDEATARDATPGKWAFGWSDYLAGSPAGAGTSAVKVSIDNPVDASDNYAIAVVPDLCGELGWENWANNANHIATHDPTRVLRECEAKRRIVEQYLEVSTSRGNDAMSRLEWTLRHLAAVYSDHPDYSIAWRP